MDGPILTEPDFVKKHRQQQMEWREICSISEIQLNLKKHRLAETNRNLELNHSTNQ